MGGCEGVEEEGGEGLGEGCGGGIFGCDHIQGRMLGLGELRYSRYDTDHLHDETLACLCNVFCLSLSLPAISWNNATSSTSNSSTLFLCVLVSPLPVEPVCDDCSVRASRKAVFLTLFTVSGSRQISDINTLAIAFE